MGEEEKEKKEMQDKTAQVVKARPGMIILFLANKSTTKLMNDDQH